MSKGALTSAQMALLARLVTCGPTRVSDLAAALRVRTPSITVSADRLMRMGLVTRSSTAADHRGVLIDITEQGRQLFGHAQAERDQRAVAAVDRLSERERELLRGALPILEELVTARDWARPPKNRCQERSKYI